MAEVVALPGKCEAQSSNPSTTKKKRKRKIKLVLIEYYTHAGIFKIPILIC
jgi:hypothetical protein